MSDERIDIEVTDKVSPQPAKKLREIASEALKADTAIDRLKASLKEVDASAVTRLANASAKLTNAQAREVSANARLENARSRSRAETDRAAIATQRLATEQARTEASTERAAAASSRARSALIAEESASIRLAAAKSREAAAQGVATSAANRAAVASTRAARTGGVAAHQTQNLIYQVNDVVVGLASGQKPMTVLLQQGSQIATVFGPGKGVLGIFRALGGAMVTFLAPFAPIIAAVGVVAAGVAALTHEVNLANDPNAFADLQGQVNKLTKEQREGIKVAVTMGDVIRASAQLAAEGIMSFLASAIDFLAPAFKAVYDFVLDATKFVVNGIVGYWVGTFNAIKIVWNNFPAIMQDVAALTINSLIDVYNAGMRGVVGIFSGSINNITGLFVGGYNAVVGVWQLLPSAFRNLGVAAMNGIITVVEAGLRGLIKGVGDFLRWLGGAFELVNLDNPFADMLTGDAIDLSQYKGQLEDTGAGIAETISGSFREAFSRDYAAGLVEALDVSGYKQEVTGAASNAARDIGQAYEDAFTTDFAGGAFAAIQERATQLARERIKAQIEEANGAGGGKQNAELSTKQKLLEEILKPLVDYRENTAALNELLAEGAISLGQYNEALANLQLIKDLRDVDSELTGTPFQDGAAIDEIRIAEQERLNIVQQALEARVISEQEAADRVVAINREAAEELRRAHTSSQSAILTGASSTFDSLASAAKGFAGEQSAAYKVLFATSKAFAIADSIIKIQQGIASALALPFPANIPAMAGVAAEGAAIVSAIQSVAAVGFKTGGYTGSGGVSDVAGFVHGQEYVFDAAATRRIGVSNLEAMRKGGDMPTQAYRGGETNVKVGLNVTIQNHGADKEFDVQQISEHDVIIIARDQAKQAVRDDAPAVIAADINNPNSRTSKALSASTTTQRRR